jgi:HK97 family phage major capsid protein
MKLLKTLSAERSEITEAIVTIVDRAADEARDLSETEDKNLKELKTRADEIDVRAQELHEIQVKNLEAAALRSEINATEEPDERATGRVSVTAEPLTYREDNAEHTFFTDMYKAQVLSDPSAQQRMARHQNEMEIEHRADGTSSNWAGLVIPQYLADLATSKAAAGRVFGNICRSLPLPADGLTVNVSRITTSSSVAAQASENAALSETTLDDTLQTSNVNTYAGAQDISRQALDRGTNVESMIMEDLALQYATSLNADLLNGSGSSGTHTGILNVSGIGSVDKDDATPTAPETWQQVVKLLGVVTQNRFLAPDALVMAPRRWSYIAGGLDGNSRPLVNIAGNFPSNPAAVGSAAEYGFVGNIAGVPVYVDGSMPTNLGAGADEDRVIAMRRDDVLLWEQGSGAPMVARFDSVGSANLTIKIVGFGYSAFMVRDPNAVAVLEGTLLNATL